MHAVAIVLRGRAVFCDGTMSWCHCHGQHRRLYGRGADDAGDAAEAAPSPPLQVVAAGITCTDWSFLGKRQGMEGPSARPCLIWAHEQLRRAPDVILLECTQQQPDSILLQDFRDRYSVQSAIISPVQLGWPVRRPRMCQHLSPS